MALVTDEQILDFLGIDDDEEEVEIIKQILNSVEKDVQNYIDRTLEVGTYKEYYDGSGSRNLFLNNKPITVMTKLRIYNDRYRDSYDDVDSEDYLVYEDEGRLYAFNGFPLGKQNIYVEYNAGYDPIPNDIKFAIKRIVKEMYRQHTENSEGLTSFSLGDQSISFEDGSFSKQVTRILEYYRRIPV
jgi:hypothetical protein